MIRKAGLVLVAAGLLVSSAVPARAEIVFFTSGRTMSVKSHRVDGDSLVLALRAGGEIVCDGSTVDHIAPDEVPYPEPEEAKIPDVAAKTDVSPALSAAAGQYNDIIDKVSKEHGVDGNLVRALIKVESDFHQRARSRKGAMGLMQLMPETARQYSVTDPYDPVANIEAGIRHLKGLLQRLPTTSLALAAYNAGEAAVQRFHGIPPYRETRDYVTRILELAQLAAR